MERRDYRVYFNRRDAHNGEIWSVDEGTMETERTVRFVAFNGVFVGSCCDLNAKTGEPSGWFSVPNCFAEFGHDGVIFTNREAPHG